MALQLRAHTRLIIGFGFRATEASYDKSLFQRFDSFLNEESADVFGNVRFLITNYYSKPM